jgi:hypothetical protein
MPTLRTLGCLSPHIMAWKTKHPEFREACKLGKQAADDLVEARLHHRAVG